MLLNARVPQRIFISEGDLFNIHIHFRKYIYFFSLSFLNLFNQQKSLAWLKWLDRDANSKLIYIHITRMRMYVIYRRADIIHNRQDFSALFRASRFWSRKVGGQANWCARSPRIEGQPTETDTRDAFSYASNVRISLREQRCAHNDIIH